MASSVLAGIAASLGVVLCALPAAAHPHVFAEAKVEVVGTPNGALGAVRNIWRMDELFSSSVLVDFDQNANGALDDDELVAVGSTVKESIAEWNFYTFVTADGRDVKMAPPDEIRTLWENGQLLMFFEMKPAEKIDLATTKKLVVSNFDDTFFVAFDFNNGVGDLTLVDMPADCRKDVFVPDEDEAAKQWMDSVATLGPEEEIPADGINYSQVLATKLEVSCTAAG